MESEGMKEVNEDRRLGLTSCKEGYSYTVLFLGDSIKSKNLLRDILADCSSRL